jgi:putative redox protein
MTIQVVRDRRSLMRHDIYVGRHNLATDLSVEDGGDASAPTPHDLYDAALGACMALTVLKYAKHKKMEIEDIIVSVERDAAQERAGIYRLTAALILTGDLTPEQRQELLRVADKCPIHKLMTDVTTEITTTLSV